VMSPSVGSSSSLSASDRAKFVFVSFVCVGLLCLQLILSLVL